MAGNSKRRGAVRKAPKHTAGSGGRSRQALEGRGPTPKAEDREYHAAHKRKVASDARAATSKPSSSGTRRSAPRRSTTHEIVSGRNSVLEAMRAGVPVNTVYLAARIEQDDRTREILKLASETHRPLLEVGRLELDRMTDGAVHQGVAIQVPPYAYADPDDLLEMVRGIAQGADESIAFDERAATTGPLHLGAVSLALEGHFVRVWGVSDGRGIVVATYTCGWADRGRELDECTRVVESIRIVPVVVGLA